MRSAPLSRPLLPRLGSRRGVAPICALLLLLPLLLGAESQDSARKGAKEAIGEARGAQALSFVAQARAAAESQHDVELDGLAAAAYEHLDLAPLALLAWEAVALEVGPEGRAEVDAALARLRSNLGGDLDWGQVVSGFPQLQRPALKVQESLAATARIGVGEHLGSSRCAAARFRSAEWAFWAPEESAAYKALGDAERCRGKLAPAARAYVRYQELGGKEAAVELLLKGLLQSLGSLELSAALVGGGKANYRVEVGGASWSGELDGETAVTLKYLPVSDPVEVGLTGLGIASTEETLGPLPAGQTTTHAFPVESVGLGSIQMPAELGAEVTFLGPLGPQALEAAQLLETTVGSWRIRLTNELGVIESPVEVKLGETLSFDLAPIMPTSLSLSGVPAGSTVRVFIEGLSGEFVEREVSIPIRGGGTDPATGVPLAPTLRITSLLGGSGGLFMEHPLLGGVGTDIALLPGQDNALALAWKDLEGVVKVQLAYKEWQDAHSVDLKRIGSRPKLLLGLAVGTGAGALGALAFAAVANGDVATTRALGQDKVAEGNLILSASASDAELQAREAALEVLSQVNQQHEAALASSRILAGLGFGLAAAAAGTGVGAIVLNKRRAEMEAALDEWEPWTVFEEEQSIEQEGAAPEAAPAEGAAPEAAPAEGAAPAENPG